MKQLSIKKLGIFFAMALVASTIAVPAQTTTVTTTSSGPGATSTANSTAAPAFPFIYTGYAATFQIVVTENGNAYVPPAGTTYAPTVAWTSSDPAAGLTLSANTQSVTMVLTSTDTSTSIVLTATCLAPDGKTTMISTYVIPVLAPPVAWLSNIIQTSATTP